MALLLRYITPKPYYLNDEYLSMFCRTDQLAEVGDTVDIAGTVTKKAAEETGLAVGTPVIVGGDDSGAEAYQYWRFANWRLNASIRILLISHRNI